MSKWEQNAVFEYSEYICLVKRINGIVAQKTLMTELVRCKECKYGEYRKDFNDYECHSSGCGLVYDADFYCADGEREGE